MSGPVEDTKQDIQDIKDGVDTDTDITPEEAEKKLDEIEERE